MLRFLHFHDAGNSQAGTPRMGRVTQESMRTLVGALYRFHTLAEPDIFPGIAAVAPCRVVFCAAGS